ncbi:uncharacterized protein LOC130677559 [Microplitis mediator]|uniref:uncharacterized protein LOC130677559 n=1 Tax=Microplitis mediator TaxID=375433 RepID=UPI002555E5DF|nr:uncharacterized protein LOC130677559 [Microplitis mediator]
MNVFMGDRFFVRRVQSLPRQVIRMVAEILHKLTSVHNYKLLEVLDMLDKIPTITGLRLPCVLEGLYTTTERMHAIRLARHVNARISFDTYNAPYFYTGDEEGINEMADVLIQFLD